MYAAFHLTHSTWLNVRNVRIVPQTMHIPDTKKLVSVFNCHSWTHPNKYTEQGFNTELAYTTI